MTILYWIAAATALLPAGQAATRLRGNASLLVLISSLCMLALGTALALAAAVPAALQAQASVSAAWISDVLGILATWMYAGLLVAVIDGTPPPREVLVLPALAALSFGVLPLGLHAARGAAVEPSGAPVIVTQLAVLTYYWPALGRITVLSWRYSCRVRAGHGGAGMRAVSMAAAGALIVVLARG